jgi:hypothetical protein
MALEPPGWVATTNLGVVVLMASPSFVTSTFRFPRVLGALAATVIALVLVAAPALADVSFINAKRSAAGLAPVSESGGLASVAVRHSQEMASQNRLFHSGNLAAAVSSVVPNWQGVGENVGVGSSVEDVNAMFMASATHRANILGNFNLAGVGVVQGSDGRYWVTQVFARVGTTAATPTTAAPRVATSTATAAPRIVQPRVSRSSAAPRTTVPAPAPTPPPPPKAVDGVATPRGYRVIAEDGGVFTFGDAVFAGSAADLSLDEPIVGGASTPSGQGYVLFGAKGGVFSFGDAGFSGSASDLALHAPVVAGAITPSGAGYTLFSADGGALTFGDATFAGSAVGEARNAAVVGGARTPSGLGYWLAGADGGVYAFGDATYYGSAAELGKIASPIVSMTASPSGHGYWLVGADGGVFSFGDAGYYGSSAGEPLPSPVRSLIPAPGGHGYWLLREDKQVMPFGTVDLTTRRFIGIVTSRLL